MYPLDILALVASLIASLAWPLTVLIVGLIFKKPIQNLLSGIKTFKYGGLDIGFGERVEEVRKEAEKVLPQAPSPFTGLADLHPAAAILQSWLDLETDLRAVAQRHGILDSPRLYTITIAEKLLDRNIWNEETFNIFAGLRNLRNSVVHTPAGSITPAQAFEFDLLIRRLITQLRQS